MSGRRWEARRWFVSPQYAISILLGQQAASKLTPDREAFLTARDLWATELRDLSQRASDLKKLAVASKLSVAAGDVSMSLDQKSLTRCLPYIEDALLQAR